MWANIDSACPSLFLVSGHYIIGLHFRRNYRCGDFDHSVDKNVKKKRVIGRWPRWWNHCLATIHFLFLFFCLARYTLRQFKGWASKYRLWEKNDADPTRVQITNQIDLTIRIVLFINKTLNLYIKLNSTTVDATSTWQHSHDYE